MSNVLSLAERLVNLPGSLNFRDFGGYAGAAGQRVKQGLLFRSGQLARLNPDSHAQFHGLGIGLICDLRRPVERDEQPTPFPLDDPPRLHLPLDPGSAARLRGAFEPGEVLSKPDRIAFMCAINRELVLDHADDYARMFTALLAGLDQDADAASGFLVHCTAGKDRTGIAVALVLAALGVHRDDIIADYLLTNEALDFDGAVLPMLREQHGESLDEAAARDMWGVREEYLLTALTAIDSQYVTMDNYLERALGLKTSQRDALRLHYLL